MAKTTSADVIKAVAQERAHSGSATVRAIAARLGVSHGAAHQRLRQLVNDGVLVNDGSAGSYRIANTGDRVQVSMSLLIDRESGRVLDVQLVG